jgi:segregation and condensation protein A
MSYKLKLDVFEGPLDLLLYLIKKNHLDITDIPISEITDQYMEYIEMMKLLDLNVVGEFLVMAATLMHIKSKMLLPPDPADIQSEELDPRDELMQRLQEYQQFKEIAEQLKGKESDRQQLFTRVFDEVERQELKEDSKEIFYEASLFDLITAFTKALRRAPEKQVYEVKQEEHTVDQKIHEVLHLLLDYAQINLTELFLKARSKSEIIVTFIAILELIRLREIVIVQKRVFGEIEILRNKENVLPPDSDAITEQ